MSGVITIIVLHDTIQKYMKNIIHAAERIQMHYLPQCIDLWFYLFQFTAAIP